MLINLLVKILVKLLDLGLLPGCFIRQGARLLSRARLRKELKIHRVTRGLRTSQFALELEHNPILLDQVKKKEEEFVSLLDFFRVFLGPYLNFSCAYWPLEIDQLEQAEEEMFNLICKRSGLINGDSVLILGTRWGGFALWLAGNYPQCQITVSAFSKRAAEIIVQRSRDKGISNLEVVVSDLDDLRMTRKFTRIIALESFARVSNFGKLFKRISACLEPDGVFFIQMFCHWRFAYFFPFKRDSHWVGKHFLSGWLMPSEDLIFHFQKELGYQRRWRINGRHYSSTVLAWLKRLKGNRSDALAALRQVYSKREAKIWFRRWKALLLSAAEVFGFNSGEEWYLAQYIFGHLPGQAEDSSENQSD